MATIYGSPHQKIRHNLSGLYIADWKWLHLIVIAFNTCAQCSCPETSQIPMFLYISARGWGHHWYTQTNEQWEIMFKTTIDLQWKCLGTPDLKHTESTFVNFIWINAYDKYSMQTILYQFKRNMSLWKRLKCPQCMQRTWWQMVEMPHTGLRVLGTPHFKVLSGGHLKNHKKNLLLLMYSQY